MKIVFSNKRYVCESLDERILTEYKISGIVNGSGDPAESDSLLVPKILASNCSPMQLFLCDDVPKPKHISCIIGGLSDGSGWSLMHQIIAVVLLTKDISSVSLLSPTYWDVFRYFISFYGMVDII
jgi:hypothetical protein